MRILDKFNNKKIIDTIISKKRDKKHYLINNIEVK